MWYLYDDIMQHNAHLFYAFIEIWRGGGDGLSLRFIIFLLHGLFCVCSDRILTCRIKSIRSPAKVGLVVTDLITSPVVSWEGWETPPPPPSTAALLSFFAQPPAW